MQNVRIDCRKCIYYYVTWDKKFPYGCKLFNVKSMQTPSIIVYQSLGKVCSNFSCKENTVR